MESLACALLKVTVGFMQDTRIKILLLLLLESIWSNLCSNLSAELTMKLFACDEKKIYEGGGKKLSDCEHKARFQIETALISLSGCTSKHLAWANLLFLCLHL